MSEIATHLLATFDSLPQNEQHELLAEMLRRTGGIPATLLTDDQLVGLADELFQGLDVEESDGSETSEG